MAVKGDLGVAEEQISWVNSDELELESVYISVDVNVDDGVNVDGGVSSSSGSLEPYIGMEFEDVEGAQTFSSPNILQGICKMKRFCNSDESYSVVER
ncbi:hypothetical protein EZV62_008173 [Acer yangbiense]|uniref:Uncharacterized protein n=1 Tax=Acer yangbiense TaxID=1000413 RepID=A0A5C7ICY3_9ROSI|nr:hypothetical protein EZV62_008173 [Acer yangbiense]